MLLSMSGNEDYTGQIFCCGDVKEWEGGLYLQTVGLRSEGGSDPVDAVLLDDACQALHEASIKPGDFISARVKYHRMDERFEILGILTCEKEEESERKSLELQCSIQTTRNLPEGEWE